MSPRILTVNEQGFAFAVTCGDGRPLLTVHMIGHALSVPMTTALVVCGLGGLEEDHAALRELGVEYHTVIATLSGLESDCAMVDHVAILDPALPEGFAAIRGPLGNMDFASHLLGGSPDEFERSGADYRWAFNPKPILGCEVSFAVHLALALQVQRVILAGMIDEKWDDERLTTWRELADGGFYSGRVQLARSAGPLMGLLPTPIRENHTKTSDALEANPGRKKR